MLKYLKKILVYSNNNSKGTRTVNDITWKQLEAVNKARLTLLDA